MVSTSVAGPKPANGFRLQALRWVVERTSSRINHCRRTDRYDQLTFITHEGLLILSQIAPLLHRLDRDQLFDTL